MAGPSRCSVAGGVPIPGTCQSKGLCVVEGEKRELVRPLTDGREATVDGKQIASHPARFITGKIDRGIGNVPGGPLGLQGYHLATALTRFLTESSGQRGVD